MTSPKQHLARRIGFFGVLLYGIGTIVGAGIYVLIGKVAGVAGYLAPWAFVLAGIIATFSAFSFAELSGRFPKSAGEAVYVKQAFHHSGLSVLVAWMVISIGAVSASAIVTGFIGYFQVIWPINDLWVPLILMLLLSTLVCIGIRSSIIAAAVMTLIEVGGIVWLLLVTYPDWSQMDWSLYWLPEAPGLDSLSAIVIAAFLAFYAFLGFEDMVNLAEEVKHPQRNLPWAIITALVITTLLYLLTAFAVLSVMTPMELKNSSAPFADIIGNRSNSGPHLIALLTMVALGNGVLAQLIMISRVLYGMDKPKALHWLSYVHPKLKTPIPATLLTAAVMLIFSYWLPLEALVRITSYLVLMVFLFINAALWWLKRPDQTIIDSPTKTIVVPRWVPAMGFITCLIFMVAQWVI